MTRQILGAIALVLLLLVPFAADPVVTPEAGAALLAANIMPVILLWLVLLGIGRRWLWASALSASLLCLIYATNAAKLVHLGEPLLFADFLLASQVVLGWQMMLGYVSPAMLLAIFACVAVAVIVFRLDRPLPFAVSLPSLAVGLGGFYLLAATPVVPDELYGSRAFGSKPWRTETFSQQQGLVASLITQTRSTQLQLPPVDNETIAAFQERHPPAPVTAETQPDIVLWLAESFFDPAIVEGVGNCGTLPQWCELLEQGIASSIKVPTYGGNTTRTEFEVLTGVPFHSIKALDFPYTSVVTRPHTSIAQALKQQQYRTVAVHPHHKNFWRREFALPLLGFDEFEALEGFEDARNDSYWIADSELGDKVRELLQEQDQPTFVFAISMEGHGPWGQRKNLSDETLASLPVTPAMRGRGARQWREYIYHAHHAVEEMNRMYRYIQQRDRPTLLVYFGDHLPGLNDTFAQVSFKNDLGAKRQLVPVLALANYPIESTWQPGHSHDLGVWTLALSGQAEFAGFTELAHAYRMRSQHPNDTAIERALDALKIRQLYIRDFSNR